MTLPQFVILLSIAAGGLVSAQEDGGEQIRIKEIELEEVRERISDLKKSMDRSAAERDRLSAELQELEVAISEQRLRVAEIEREQARTEEKKARLDAEQAERQSAFDNESEALAAQVRSAYMSGGQDRLRLLLNQQDPAVLGRIMAWYRYLSEHRAATIAAVAEQLRRLESIRSEIAAEVARLEQLADNRRAQLARLNASQGERQTLLANLKSKLAEEGREVERLAAEERDLTRLIAELTSILSDYPINSEQPFSDHKGKLTWPVAGTLLHEFGQPRVGGSVKWNGVVLAAPRGREVRAVYHGRVAFADWLAGMGLLIIVDHGEGYMSLYGYNETLLKDAGDWVAPGDVIATVGDSGGQPQAALYFELRRGADPVNPGRWVTRRPGAKR